MPLNSLDGKTEFSAGITPVKFRRTGVIFFIKLFNFSFVTFDQFNTYLLNKSINKKKRNKTFWPKVLYDNVYMYPLGHGGFAEAHLQPGHCCCLVECLHRYCSDDCCCYCCHYHCWNSDCWPGQTKLRYPCLHWGPHGHSPVINK